MLSNTEKNCNVQTCLMSCVWFFILFFSMHKTVRPANIDKVADLAQHPKSLGTTVLNYYSGRFSFLYQCFLDYVNVFADVKAHHL